MSPIQIFLTNHWSNINSDLKDKFTIKSDFVLENSQKADIAILVNGGDNKILALGKCFDKINKPTENNIRYYFHEAGDFIGCGTESNIWFYFDSETIIINDHRYTYPYDEIVKSIDEFYSRMVGDLEL